MTNLTLVLIILFLFNMLTNFYDSGAYAHGKKVIKEGNGYAAASLVAGVANLILVAGLVLGW